MSGLDLPCQTNVARLKVLIPTRYKWMQHSLIFAGCLCYLCVVILHWKLDKSSGIRQLIGPVLEGVLQTLWKAPRCLLLAPEARRGSDRGLSLSALPQRSLLAFWLSASAGARVFQKRALATGRQASQPARQAASRIVCSLGLGLEPVLGQLMLPRQIC